MLDATPKILIELRDDDAVAAITTRIRIREPAPPVIHPTSGAVLDAGDVRQGTEDDPYVAFVVLVRLDGVRALKAPVQRSRIAVRAYGRTSVEAAQLAMACSDAVHGIGPRLHSGTGIYISHDDTGGSQDTDPNTQQPVEEFVISLIATTQAVA